MLRRFGAAAAVLAFLYGFSAAPFAHRHHAIDSVSDEQHPHGETLVHTHTSPHSHHGADRSEPRPAGREDSDEQIWSVASFVPHQSAFSHTQPPALQVFGELYVELTSVRLARATQRRAGRSRTSLRRSASKRKCSRLRCKSAGRAC